MIGEEVIAYYGDAGDGEELFEKSKLVRCKDCYWFDNEDYGEPTRYCKWHESIIKQDDFCSYGERKDNE